MRSPFSIIMPATWGFSLIFISAALLFVLPLLRTYRSLRRVKTAKARTAIFPRWITLKRRGVVLLVGSLLRGVRVSLIPLRVIGLHFPVWGIGLSISLWVIITLLGGQTRALQYKKEYLGDSTLNSIWVIMSLFIERIRRGARAVTLGARISVNIIIGGILHRVIGEARGSWGILGLAVFEILVVLIQVYVLILLLCLYTIELA